MAGLDRTGPLGQGSRTGRKRGLCNPDAETQSDTSFSRRWFTARSAKGNSPDATGVDRSPGRGFGRFWGRNRGRQV